jgi:histidine triad (HIT) family protein
MDCIFCQIVARRRSADIIYEDELAVAFRDVRPQTPVHILVIPREHIDGPLDVNENNERIVGHLVAVASRVARQEGIAAGGYRLVINQGHDGGQSVFHLHMHVLGGRRMLWPPG